MKQVFLFILFLVVCTPLYAEKMSIDADKFELFHAEQRAEFKGRVLVHRGDMVIKADNMRILYHEKKGTNKLKSAWATGSVFIETPEHKGWADKATFSSTSDMLVLTGNAKVKGEQGLLEGEQIEYNIVTKDTQVLKGKVNKQVRFTFGEDGE